MNASLYRSLPIRLPLLVTAVLHTRQPRGRIDTRDMRIKILFSRLLESEA
jgi:hypothetical protein